jgi:Ca2+-transporting ATPase
MIERTLLAGAVFGGIGLAAWLTWMREGMALEAARNLMVQLFVLFEIFHIGNSRSESISLFRLSPLRNPLLFAGTLAALGVHVAAVHWPFTQRLLDLAPPSLEAWLSLAGWAITIVVVMELHKAFRSRRPIGRLARPAPAP